MYRISGLTTRSSSFADPKRVSESRLKCPYVWPAVYLSVLIIRGEWPETTLWWTVRRAPMTVLVKEPASISSKHRACIWQIHALYVSQGLHISSTNTTELLWSVQHRVGQPESRVPCSDRVTAWLWNIWQRGCHYILHKFIVHQFRTSTVCAV